jgi:hypothetical protein
MPSATSLFLPFIFTLLDHPIVDFGAWAGRCRCHCADLIVTHIGESQCDEPMVVVRCASVNDFVVIRTAAHSVRRLLGIRPTALNDRDGARCCLPAADPNLAIAT